MCNRSITVFGCEPKWWSCFLWILIGISSQNILLLSQLSLKEKLSFAVLGSANKPFP